MNWDRNRPFAFRGANPNGSVTFNEMEFNEMGRAQNDKALLFVSERILPHLGRVGYSRMVVNYDLHRLWFDSLCYLDKIEPKL